MEFCGTYSQLPEVMIIDAQILINLESFLFFNNIPGINLANTRVLCIFYHLLLLPFLSLFLDTSSIGENTLYIKIYQVKVCHQQKMALQSFLNCCFCFFSLVDCLLKLRDALIRFTFNWQLKDVKCSLSTQLL